MNAKGLKPEHIEAPLMCNDFSVFGKATSDGKHYFGRNFMFPTGGIFEYMFCMTIYCPDDNRLPMVVNNDGQVFYSVNNGKSWTQSPHLDNYTMYTAINSKYVFMPFVRLHRHSIR
ncbi:hypothetical protein [Candidatus Uabimicrobium sp. HlEnr_7]|uniref:hypothetical protein n=1 Tax=Candidatus Uabimicrobium helgolandensis TaxID=3095367 RepID=UPI003558047F